MHEIEFATNALSGLSRKQRDVLDLVLKHKTSKEIARVLSISPYTVDQRLNLARKKLGVASRGELARSYEELVAICEKPLYDSSGLALLASWNHMDGEVQPEHLVHSELNEVPEANELADAVEIADQGWPIARVGLEVLDRRYGIVGRVYLIILIALLLAMVFLAIVAIGSAVAQLE